MQKNVTINCVALGVLVACDLSASQSIVKSQEFREVDEFCESTKTGKESLEGWFAGIGLAWKASDSKADTIKHQWSGMPNVDLGSNFDQNDLNDIFTDYNIGGNIEFEKSVRDNNVLHSVKVTTYDFNYLAKENLSKFAGVVAVGYGRFMGNIYLGLEFLVDISRNKVKREGVIVVDDCRTLRPVELKSNGVEPSFVAISGFYSSKMNALFYAKLGVCNLQSEVRTNIGKVKLSRFSPLIGLGVKKSISNNISLSCELDYAFGSNKKADISGSVYPIISDDACDLKHTSTVRMKQKGYAVRTLVEYHF